MTSYLADGRLLVITKCQSKMKCGYDSQNKNRKQDKNLPVREVEIYSSLKKLHDNFLSFETN